MPNERVQVTGRHRYSITMTPRDKPAEKKAARGLILGRAAAAKINAVEGVSISKETHRAFAEFDRLGLAAEERRRRLLKQFGMRSG